jgi:hypothetical protein
MRGPEMSERTWMAPLERRERKHRHALLVGARLRCGRPRCERDYAAHDHRGGPKVSAWLTAVSFVTFSGVAAVCFWRLWNV